VVRILPSEAQDVGKEEDRGAGGRGLGYGMWALVSAIPCVLAIYRLKKNVCQSLVTRRERTKAMVWLKRTQKEKEFGLVTNRQRGLEFSLDRETTVCPLTDPCLKSCFGS